MSSDTRQTVSSLLIIWLVYAKISGVTGIFVFSEARARLAGAGIKINMDRYVHVTDNSLTKAIRQFEGSDAKKQIGAELVRKF